MKNYFAFIVALSILVFFSCSKNTSNSFTNPTIIGKWVLTKSCACNSCIDTIAFYQSESIIFSVGKKVQIFSASGNAERRDTGSYSITQQGNNKILNVALATDSNKNFLFIPGSIISSETGTTLMLDLNTPYANLCTYENTYTAVPE